MKTITKLSPNRLKSFVPGRVYQAHNDRLWLCARISNGYTLIDLTTGENCTPPRTVESLNQMYAGSFDDIPTGTKLEFEQ